MKRLLVILFIAFIIIGIWTFGNFENSSENTDSVAADSTITIKATGVVIDGAMNSVTIVSDNGDTLNFSYPDLAPEQRYAWAAGDTITVTYTTIDGEDIVAELKKKI